MRFADPWFLLLLPMAWALFFFFNRRKTGRVSFSSLFQLKTVIGGSVWNSGKVPTFLRVVAVSLLILAAARPQTGKKVSEVTSDGVDILLALDTSGSMRALDLKLENQPVPRIDVVKKEAGDFVNLSPHDRLGIVVFGEHAFVQCPLTLDHDILQKLLADVQVGVAGDSTSIGDAIGVAVNHMKNLKAKSRVVVLLTDGESNSGVIPPLKAAEIAKAYQVKIYTIGVGIDGRAPFLVDTPLGKRVIYQQADLDEETLKKIADVTGGVFYRAKDSDTLARVYAEINRLEKTEVKVKEYHEYNELYFGFAVTALLILLLEIILSQTYLRKVP